MSVPIARVMHDCSSNVLIMLNLSTARSQQLQHSNGHVLMHQSLLQSMWVSSFY